MVAPNGARRSSADHPALPLTPEALARTAAGCRKAGASAIHLHVRDNDERHTLDPQAYRAAITAISQACPGMPIQATTESAGLFGLAEQIAAAEGLRPACLSFALGELLAEGEAPGRAFMEWAYAAGIGVQIILYDVAQVHRYARLIEAGRLPLRGPPRLILVVGRYATTQDSDVDEFDALHTALSETGLARTAHWMVCAFGRGEMACLERAIALGGHARVGFENAITDAEGRPARDNAQRVALVAEIAARVGRPIAGPEFTREVLGQSASGPLLP